MIPSYRGDWEIEVLPGTSFIVLYCRNKRGETMSLEIGHGHIEKFIEDIKQYRSTEK